MSNRLLTIKINYGRDNQILDMRSVNLTPQQASDLAKTVAVLICGYPALDELEKPENERGHEYLKETS